MSFLLMLATATVCSQYDKTEAQHHYDLGMSYVKSGLYKKALMTLSQVAFHMPSDLADDAMFEIALIYEQAGDGRITIDNTRKLEEEKEILKRLKNAS